MRIIVVPLWYNILRNWINNRIPKITINIKAIGSISRLHVSSLSLITIVRFSLNELFCVKANNIVTRPAFNRKTSKDALFRNDKSCFFKGIFPSLFFSVGLALFSISTGFRYSKTTFFQNSSSVSSIEASEHSILSLEEEKGVFICVWSFPDSTKYERHIKNG